MIQEVNPLFILIGGFAVLGGTLAVSAMNRKELDGDSPYDAPPRTLSIAEVVWAIRHADALYKGGQAIGRELTIGIEPGNIDQALDALNSVGVGEFRLEGERTRNEIHVRGGPWQGAPTVDESLCYLTLGLIRSVFTRVLGADVRVVEDHCHGTGAAECVFTMEIRTHERKRTAEPV